MTKEHIEKVIRSNRAGYAAHQLFKEFEQQRDEARAQADKLAEYAKRVAMRVLQSDFYADAKDEVDDLLELIAAYEQSKGGKANE